MQIQAQQLDNDVSEIQERIQQREQDAETYAQEKVAASGRLPNESQRDYLIRTGKITPFSKLGLSKHGEDSATLQGALFDAEDESESGELEIVENARKRMSHRNLRQPGFASRLVDSSAEEELDSDVPRKKRKLQDAEEEAESEDSYEETESRM